MGAKIRTSKGEALAAATARWEALPESLRQSQVAANNQSADEFMGLVQRIIPREKGDLAASVKKGPGKRPGGVSVSVGDEKAPYPAGVEFGHMVVVHGTRTAVHVPAEPFWFTSLRTLRKKFRDRRSRAARKAIKALVAGGGS